jgi:hypothetical protein
MEQIKIAVSLNNKELTGKALEWIQKVIHDKVGATSNPEETLRNLIQGIPPSRGSKGVRSDPWEKEFTTLLKGLLKKYGIDVNLRESGGIEQAIVQLSRKMGRDKEAVFQDLEKKARHIASIKSAEYND